MANNKIRLGLIGANPTQGWGPRAHLPALPYIPEIELAAVCTAHAETAQQSAEKYGVSMAFHDHRELLKRDDIDAVAIAVRVPYHHQLAMDAIRAGKHVYVEWPLGANLKEAEEMADLARQKGVKTMVGLQGRQAPAFQRAKELIDEGYVGEVLSCHLTQLRGGVLSRPSDRTWQRERNLGANSFTIAFGHSLDCFRMCVGDFSEISGELATQVHEWHETDTGKDVEVTSPDHILVTGRLANGALALLRVADVAWHAGAMNKMEVFGREGTIEVVFDGTPQIDGLRLIGGKGTDGSLSPLPIPDRLIQVPEGVPTAGPPSNIARLYQRFAEAINTGERREPDFDTAVGLHRILDTIERASDKGMRLPVPA